MCLWYQICIHPSINKNSNDRSLCSRGSQIHHIGWSEDRPKLHFAV